MRRSLNFFTRQYLFVLAMLLLNVPPSWAGTWDAFGPKSYQRQKGEPKPVSSNFSILNPNTQFTLRVTGNQHAHPTIVLNGRTVLDEDDFRQRDEDRKSDRDGKERDDKHDQDDDRNDKTITVEKAITLKLANTVAVEVEGRQGSTITVSVIGVDNDPPIISSTASPAPNAAGWNKSNVVVTFTCSDKTSGVASCPSPVNVNTEGANQVISGTATDLAGNTASASITINLDRTVPTILASPAPPANNFGWNNSAVTVGFNCADALSGIAFCTPATTFTGEGANQAANGLATDKAGNSAVASATVNIDETPPTITSTATPSANAAGWNNTNVTVVFICADTLSGVASCPSATNVTTEGANQSISGTATDKAGNTANTARNLNIDKTPPTITVVVTPAANAQGVVTAPATVTFSCTDTLSGVATCPPPVQVTTAGLNEPFSGTATDKAGNPASANVSVSVQLTPLTITATASPAANANGWNTTATTITYTCSGGVSPLQCPAAQTVSAEGANQVISATVTDAAGQTATTTTTLNIDKTPPVITATVTPAANALGVVTAPATVTFTCTDTLSGVATCPSAIQVTTADLNESFSGTATDKAGNTASASVTISVQLAPLTITATASPTANANGWNNTAVIISYQCSGGVPPVQCPASQTVSAEGANQAISATATDAAGQTATASTTLNIDKTPPVITAAVTPAANAQGVVTAPATVTFTCSDALSGVATCPSAIQVTAAGLNESFSGSATDKAGNTTSASVTISVQLAPLAITATASPAANANGWNNAAVTVSYQCSGGVPPLQCPAAQTVSTEGANQSISATATDAAGQTAIATTTLNIDKTPPTIAAAVTPAPNPQGVVTAPATVTFTCSDALSGIATCPSAIQVTTVGLNESFTGTATDKAGNAANASTSFSVESAPLTVAATATPAANANGWNNTAVTISYQCLGGVPPVQCPAAQTVTTEGANQIISATVTDAAGQTVSATTTLNIDKTPPTITASVSPTPGVNGLINATSAMVSFTCSDSLSGVLSCPSPVTVTTTGLQTINGTATDNAGNTATASMQFNLQPFPPLKITASASPAPNAAGWNNSPMTVTFVCTGGAPPVSCPGTQTVDADGANQVISGTATDSFGNSATTSVTVNLDQSPPLVSVTSPADGSVVPSTTVAISGLVNDLLSGVAGVSCNGSPATLSSGVFACTVQITQGSLALSVEATDVAGNTASASLGITLQGPKLTITSPSALDLFNSSTITVAGTVDDPNAVITVNGVQATSKGGTFTANGVILREGNNLVTATGTNAGGATGTASINVVLDTTPPTVLIDSPSDKAILTTPEIMVTGLVNDIVTGTVNNPQVTVTINGVKADVGNRSFMAHGVLLVPGQNVITAVATDRAGNVNQSQVTVTLQDAATQQRILMVSGNGQSGPIGTTLPQPLVVQVVNAAGQTVLNLPVTFAVNKSDGLISAFPQQGRQLVVQTDANGQASVNLQLGTRVGNGNNQVIVTAPGFVGEIMFGASATLGPAAQIHAISGESQKGVIGQGLPEPLIVSVSDASGNAVAGVPVVFTVTQGGGSLEGSNTVTKTTDSDGRAAAVLVLAQEEGVNNNVVNASFSGITGTPASFISSGMTPRNPTSTTVSGIVLDDANQPIPNATASIRGTNLSALTGKDGQFTIANAPVGTIDLFVDGSTSTDSDTYPFLEFPMVTVAGQDNHLGSPIFLPALDVDNSKIVGGDQDVDLTMKGVPGLKFTVFAHSATFPDGSHVGRLLVSQVHSDKVPMPPPGATATALMWTIQPPRVRFNPPIRVELPNTNALPAGTVTDTFSYNHDLEQFVSGGTARVSEDGSVIVSDPGFGLVVSGWGGSPPPQPPPPTCANGCNTGDTCRSGQCVNGACQFTNQPDGTGCDDHDSCTVQDKCQGGACKGDKIEITKVEAKADGQDKEDFQALMVSGTTVTPVDVHFTANVTQNNCSQLNYKWDFGDGMMGTDQNPVHTYMMPGAFNVTVDVDCNPPCDQAKGHAQVKVNILKATVLAADVTHDQIQVTMEPNTVTGTLHLELMGANTRQVGTDLPGLTGSTTQSFHVQDLGNLTNANGDDYTSVRATWTVTPPNGGANVVVRGTLNYHILVLGEYRHSVYNTPTESSCGGGGNANVFVLPGPAPTCFNGVRQGVMNSLFVQQVDINGSGVSNNFGNVKSLAATSCARGQTDQPSGATGGANGNSFVQVGTITGSCNGTLDESSVAACAADGRLVCGAQVFIDGLGVKTVRDGCPACCQDANFRHLDNYTFQPSCRPHDFQDLPRAVTIRIF